MVPTIYTFDSAELTVGAEALGIVHAPGYPLYLLVGHLFCQLPIGDVGFRMNLFSAISLAVTAAFLYGMLAKLTDRWVALSATLTFAWSYYVWTAGLVAEVYAPQLATLAACGWAIAHLHTRLREQTFTAANRDQILFIGFLFGLAVAMHPVSVLFAPGLVAAFVLLRVPWRLCLVAAGIAILVFLVPLIYFPLRYTTDPALNMAGHYTPDGVFHHVDLRSMDGIVWMLRGEQFDGLFFVDGWLPSCAQWSHWLTLFSGNYLAVGLLMGALGLYALAVNHRGVGVIWLLCFVPYTYFYLTYGALDVETMFGPSYLVWAVTIAYGVQWATETISKRVKVIGVLLLPALFLVVNFPLVDSHDDTEIRDMSEHTMMLLPSNAAVFGFWWEVVPLQYLQIVEGQRPDVHIYNLFQMDMNNLQLYLDGPLIASDQPVIFVSQAGVKRLDPERYEAVPLDEQGTYEISAFLIVER